MTYCAYFPKCRGCNLWNLPYEQQQLEKISYLKRLFSAQKVHFDTDIEFISCGEHSLRHRVDFTIEFNSQTQQHDVGFYDESKKLIHIITCLQLSPELQKIYSEFIQFSFFYDKTPIKKGSVRLRVGPQGLKGCWLDFSNIEIKHLLADQFFLNQLLEAGFIVEIGQKAKSLQKNKHGLFKLSEPQPHTWFLTLNSNNKPLDLKCLVSDFTQPSWQSANRIVLAISDWLFHTKSVKTILEFGAGIGQFTLCFLAHGIQVEACEINKSALEQLQLNAQAHHLENNLVIQAGDFHKKIFLASKKFDLIFVNPARSGLKLFTEAIIASQAEYLIYVSCFPDTLASDLAQLSKNYGLCNIKIIDQFPQTNHFETYTLLKKIT